MFYWLLCENSAVAKLVRTVLQGIAGVLIAALPQVHDAAIHALTEIGLPEFMVLAIVPIVMAILAPAMAKLGEWAATPKFSECVVCDADGNVIPLEEALEDCPETDDSDG